MFGRKHRKKALSVKDRAGLKELRALIERKKESVLTPQTRKENTK
jgi:hypothetical protein